MNGNQIDLKVEVTDFQATQGCIEISGQATQVGGAFAPIYQVVDFASEAKQEPDGWFVTVTAGAIPPVRFKKDQDITVFVRVARVWVTVLGQPGNTGYQAGTDADPETTWTERDSAQLTKQPWTA
jgi:hypothetical protein